MRLPVCLLLIVIAAPVFAKDASEKVLRYARNSEVQRMKLIEKLEASSNGAIRKNPTAEYKKLIDPFEPYFGTQVRPDGSKSDMGIVIWSYDRVEQVNDNKNVLVELGTHVRYQVVTAVVGGKKIYRPRSRVDYRGPICVKGVDTSELVDGEHFSAQGVFEVLGNYTYDTAGGGTNTVKQIGLIDLSEYEDLFTLKHTAREWSDKSGEHTIKALFIEHKSGIVHLKTTDGEEKKIKLSALSKDDQKYVREKVTGKRR